MEQCGHRIAISVRRILDSCTKQISEEDLILNLERVPPALPTPFKFVSALSTRTEAQVSNLSIEKIREREGQARVRCNVAIPMRVDFLDADDKKHHARSEIVVPIDIILFIPEASVFPFEIVAAASVSATNGRYINNKSFRVTACIAIIIKVIAETDLLIPAYGYSPSPKAVDFNDDKCKEFFELPLFPSGAHKRERGGK
jgi:hypothetical protein